jgi:Bacterial TSP3 repeat
MFRLHRWCAAALMAAASGCVYGFVRDTNNAVVSGVSVVSNGNCGGAGCGPIVAQTTDSNGRFVFDAYGNVNGEANVQIIVPAAGEESIRLVFSKPGFQSRTVFHKPKYQEVEQEGKKYSISGVQQVFLCASGSVDSDGDGVCDAAELRYQTSPTNSDTDGDNISDGAELFGLGGVDLRYYGANALKKDVFIEADYYAGLKPTQAAIDRVTNGFAAAPVSNPDGTTGIAFHLDLDQQIAAADADADLNLAVNWNEFDAIKNSYFAPRRAPFFHYMLFANRHSGTTSSGKSRGIPAHDFVVTLGGWSPAGGTELQQAGTLMHEFGHNLGLRHGGTDNVNYKANYFSVMNYSYQTIGLTVGGTPNVMDYSRLRIASVNETTLSEPAAFSPLAPTTETDLVPYSVRIGSSFASGNASVNLDFNKNGSIQPGTIAADLNNDGDTSDTIAASQIDWSTLVFDGAGTIGDALLGAKAGVARPSLYLLTPTNTPDCLTAP